MTPFSLSPPLLLSPLPPPSFSSCLPLSLLLFTSCLSLLFSLTSSPCRTPRLFPPPPEALYSTPRSSLLLRLSLVTFLTPPSVSPPHLNPPLLAPPSTCLLLLLPSLHLLLPCHILPFVPPFLLTLLLPPHPLLYASPLLPLLHPFLPLHLLLFLLSHLIVLLLLLRFPPPLRPLPSLLVSLLTSGGIVQFLRSTFRSSLFCSSLPFVETNTINLNSRFSSFAHIHIIIEAMSLSQA